MRALARLADGPIDEVSAGLAMAGVKDSAVRRGSLSHLLRVTEDSVFPPTVITSKRTGA
jgi:hypothetical protein